jgi:hypothetical protein
MPGSAVGAPFARGPRLARSPGLTWFSGLAGGAIGAGERHVLG